MQNSPNNINPLPTAGFLPAQTQGLELLSAAFPTTSSFGIGQLPLQMPMLLTNSAATQIQATPDMSQALLSQGLQSSASPPSNPLGNIGLFFSQLMSGLSAMFQQASMSSLGSTSSLGGMNFSQLLSGLSAGTSASPGAASTGLAQTSLMARQPEDPNHVTRKVPGRKVAHSTPYYKANSPQGLEAAHAKGYKWADLDFRVTKDGVPVNIHGAPENAFLNGKKVEDMTWAEVSTLRHDGYRIHTAEEMFAKAKELGMNIEFETKGSKAFQSSAAWNSVANAAQKAWGADWQKHVEVKTLTNLSGGFDAARNRLEGAHNAGFTTLLLVRDGDTDKLINDPVIDYVRGSSRKYPK